MVPSSVGAAEKFVQCLAGDAESEAFCDLLERIAFCPEPANLSLVIPQA